MFAMADIVIVCAKTVWKNSPKAFLEEFPIWFSKFYAMNKSFT
jgi:hypothetical protein